MTDWLLIEGGKVLDVMAGAGRRADVLVRDDRIVEVGDNPVEGNVARGDRVERVDATDRTVMPGMIDAHCHLSFGEVRAQEEQDLYTSVELRTLRSAASVRRVLRAGVTGVSDPGGSYYIAVGLRDAIREGLVAGPRVFAAGQFIATANGLGVQYPSSVGQPAGAIGILTDTIDEMVRAVRTQVHSGVDLIKLSDSVTGEFEAFTPDEIKQLSDLTHGLRRRVTIHARGSANVDAAVAAGVDWIMHGNIMTDETIERLAESKIPLCPTLAMCINYAEWGHLIGVPPATRDRWKRVMDRTAESLHKATEAGVRMITGTDSGFAVTPYGEWHARELRALIEYAGLSTEEAIRAATVNAAVTLGLEGQVGEVAAGKLADIIVVDGDPLAEIRLLEDHSRIQTVIKAGKVVRFETDPDDEPRRSFQRAQVWSTGTLTRGMTIGEPDQDTPAPVPGGMDLASDVRRRIRAAGQDGVRNH